MKLLEDSEKDFQEFTRIRDYNKSQADNQMQRKNIQDAA